MLSEHDPSKPAKRIETYMINKYVSTVCMMDGSEFRVMPLIYPMANCQGVLEEPYIMMPYSLNTLYDMLCIGYRDLPLKYQTIQWQRYSL